MSLIKVVQSVSWKVIFSRPCSGEKLHWDHLGDFGWAWPVNQVLEKSNTVAWG